MGMWTEITVENAEDLRDFYTQVFGWTVQDVEMEDGNGKYVDYAMVDKDGDGVSGVCHKRGVNKDMPAQWIVYFTVDDLSKSVETCTLLGGKVLKEIKNDDGNLMFVLIEDPTGAVIGVLQSEHENE